MKKVNTWLESYTDTIGQEVDLTLTGRASGFAACSTILKATAKYNYVYWNTFLKT
jgi:hypothetical protein